MASYSKLIVDLDPELHARFIEYAASIGASKAGLVRSFIKNTLTEKEDHPTGKLFASWRKKKTVVTKRRPSKLND